MKPAEILRRHVTPNVEEATRHRDSFRHIANAVVSLDALAGHIHAWGYICGLPGMGGPMDDDRYKEGLAIDDVDFRIVRDLAAALKHGRLADGRGNSLPRLLTSGDALQSFGGSGLGMGPLGSAPFGTAPVIEIAHGRDSQERTNAADLVERVHDSLALIVASLPDQPPASA